MGECFKIPHTLLFSIFEPLLNTQETITMQYTPSLAREIHELITQLHLNSSVDRFIQDDVNWSRISAHKNLSEEFMERFKDKLDWNLISEHQVLHENLIEKFKDRVNWQVIAMHQKLSPAFVEKYKEQLKK